MAHSGINYKLIDLPIGRGITCWDERFHYDPFAEKTDLGSKGAETILGEEKTSEATSTGSTPTKTSPIVDP